MANIRHFKELRVWQWAMDAAMRIYEAILSQLTVMSEHPAQWVIRSQAGDNAVPASASVAPRPRNIK